MGRPAKLTQNLSKSICDGIAKGLSLKEVCNLLKISEQSVRNYKAKGETEQEGLFFEFFEDLRRAEALFHLTCLEHLQNAMEGTLQKQVVKRYFEPIDDPQNPPGIERTLVREVEVTETLPIQWQAIAWLLERRFPQQYGK